MRSRHERSPVFSRQSSVFSSRRADLFGLRAAGAAAGQQPEVLVRRLRLSGKLTRLPPPWSGAEGLAVIRFETSREITVSESESTVPRRKRRPAAVGCAGLLAAVIVLVGGYLWWAWTLPPWAPSPVELPEPNAFDVYVSVDLSPEVDSGDWPAGPGNFNFSTTAAV